MADEKTCFIIMPITTPEDMVETYRDGKDHFIHVLDCLFVPSAQKAGYEPIKPLAKGSDLIHAEIIKNLETADLVLCDMSCLNPNVFFEFGIRTSLNKPVCVVKDEYTKRVPFDTGILNHQEYKSSLDSWHLEGEIEKLAEHIISSADRSKDKNTLWKYFGLRADAEPYRGAAGPEDQLDYLVLQIESLQRKVDSLDTKTSSQSLGSPATKTVHRSNIEDQLLFYICREFGIPIIQIRIKTGEDDKIIATFDPPLETSQLAAIHRDILRNFAVELEFD